MKTYTKFLAQIYVSTKDESEMDFNFVSNSRPRFWSRTTDVSATVVLAEDAVAKLGNDVSAMIELGSHVPIEQGN